MRNLAAIVLVGMVALSAIGSTEPPDDSPAVREGVPVVRWVDFETTVNPVTVKRITNAIDDAEEAGDDLVLIRLDTPGGLVVSMESIVKRMLDAQVPIAVWVGPPGAKAASAGFFILVAADVAAMAPGTRTGAASTVVMGESKEGDVHLKKSNEDLAALVRSIAGHRNRNIEACEQAVLSAKAYEESVALDEGIIDLVAGDRDELLRLLDSTEITRFDGTTVVLHVAGARFVTSEFSVRHEFMEILGDPTVAYLLFMLGMLGLYVEFSHPGLVLPGVVGALCLLLFAFASQVLPVSAIGILLILLATVMFLLEIKVASYGMLTAGGVISLIVGSVMLIEGPIPEMRVPLGVVLPTSIVIALLCAFVVRLVVRAHRARVGTGVEGLAGALATVTEDLAPQGKVFLHGETWNASTEHGPLPRGTRVRVSKVDELELTVEPLSEAARRRE